MKNIPVITIQEKSLARAYENALVSLYKKGTQFKTQYDKPGDPLSLDCTMNLTVLEPESDPMIHKAFPGGIDELKEYVLELKGFKDHWVKNLNDPEDTRWEYTYHGRLVAYGSWKELDTSKNPPVSVDKGFHIDQISDVVNKLVEQPHTRQAQMITWMPNIDLEVYDPPCLQSLWYRILEDEDGTQWLNCNVRFRSNDAWGASFMNMFGFIQFNKEVMAAEIEKLIVRRPAFEGRPELFLEDSSVLGGGGGWHFAEDLIDRGQTSDAQFGVDLRIQLQADLEGTVGRQQVVDVAFLGSVLDQVLVAPEAFHTDLFGVFGRVAGVEQVPWREE